MRSSMDLLFYKWYCNAYLQYLSFIPKMETINNIKMLETTML